MLDFDDLHRFLETAAPELKDYLLSGEIYWNIGVRAREGAPPYPRFSMGWLLLFRRKITVFKRPAALAPIDEQIQRVQSDWRSAWGRKAALEFGVRLNQWTRFMNELRADPAAQANRYRYEVQRRVLLDLLAGETDNISEQQRSLVRSMDAALQGLLKKGEFVDDPVFEPAFDADRFWYLYGEIRT